ncbi:MAG: response regulator transcription factor [Candidatus Obscuribacterales bacterium]|nr:response regulator transcription factor [Candidatus Obscuribacterales bacterium]
MSKILVAEDDTQCAELIGMFLERSQHVFETVTDGAEALDRLKLYSYDLVILDWNLPRMSGVDVLKTYRARGGKTPVLMLTALKSINSKVEGLEAGADDYLTKPFDGSELQARLKALLRRPPVLLDDVLNIADIQLDTASHRVTKSGVEVKLRPKEIALLEFFLRHKNQLFTAEQILEQVWSSESDATTEAIVSCIKRVRKVLDEGREGSIIRNVHGAGYGIFAD